MEFAPVGKDLLHHGLHVALAERDAQHLVAHAASGGVGHLGILDVIARVGEKIVIAGVVPVHVRGNDVIDFVWLHAQRLQTFIDGVNDFSRALLGSSLIKSGIAYEGSVWSLDHPHVVRNRGHLIVRIAENVVLGTLTRVARVADRVDLVDVVAHDFLPTVTPARFSIILTMAVKSLSPPYSVLVVSH